MADTVAGDTSTTGTLAPGDSINSAIDFVGDTDWYRANLLSGWGYQIWLEGLPSGNGTLFDPFVKVFNAQGLLQAEDDDAGTGLDAYLYFAPAETAAYFIDAQGADPSMTGTYRLRLVGDELDTTASQAVMSPDSSVTGSLGSMSDVADWRVVQLVAGTQYLFDLTGAAGDGRFLETLVDPWLGLHNAAGVLLIADDNAGVGLNARILYTPTVSGTYYLDAQESGQNAAGSWRLAVNSAPVEMTLGFGAPITGSIDFAGDVDLYQVTLNAGTTYDIALNSVSLLNPYLEVLGPTGEALLFNDNGSGAGLNARLAFTPTLSGIYYLAARASGHEATGTYSVGIALGDWLEPNNTAATATVIGAPLGSFQYAGLTIGTGDVDYFQVTLDHVGAAGDAVVIDFVNAQGNLDMTLYNAAATSVLATSAGVGNQESISLTGLAAGNYIVRVFGNIGQANPNYNFTFQLAPSLPDGADGFENNDTAATASILGTLSGSVTHEHLTIQAGDDDWYRFTLAAPGREGDAVALAFTHANGDVDMQLYAANGTTVLLTSAGSENSERVSLAGLAAGDYYVRVFGYQGVANPDYSLTLAVASATPAADRFEQNDTYLTATALGLVSGTRTETHLTAEANDADWYRFTLAGTGKAIDYVRVSFSQVLGDIDIALFNFTTQTLISTSATTADTEQVSLSGLAAGEYAVVVGGLNGASNPDYTLRLSVAPAGIAADRFEQNDTAGTATNLGTAGGTRTEATLTAETNESDWYRFTLAAAGRNGDSFSVAFNNAAGDIDLELYDAAGTTLLRRSTGSGNSESIDLSGLFAGEYRARVFGYNGAGNPDYSLTLAAAPAVIADRYEENDTPATAFDLRTIINTVSKYNLSAQAGDSDWFRFTLPGTGQAGDAATIFFKHSQGDVDLELYNSAGTTLLASSATVGDTESVSLQGLAAGSYLLRAFGYNGATNPSYDLTVKVAPSLVAADRYENNDTAATATDLRTISGSQIVSGLTVQSNDDDWYKFTISNIGKAGEGIQLFLNDELGDIDMQLYNAAGTTVMRQSTGNGDTEAISFEGLWPGTYLFRVYGSGNQSNPDYALLLNASPPVPGNDLFENDDTRETATNLRDITGPRTIANFTMQPNDDDWFVFSLSDFGRAGDTARIDFLQSQGDLDLFLYNSSGSLISQSSGSGNFEQVSLKGLFGDYSLRVAGYHGAQNPNYSISLNGPAAIAMDAWEFNNTMGTATRIKESNASITGATIDSVNDRDFYEFTLAQNGGASDRVNVHADRANVQVRVYDAGGTLFSTAFTDSNGNAAISIKDYAAGHWFVNVESTAAAPVARYDLEIHSEGAAKKNGWTVLVYMNGDNNLEASATEDLNEMEQSLYRSGVETVIVLDRIRGFDVGHGAWSNTRQGFVSHDTTDDLFSDLVAVPADEWNMGLPYNLTSFINWGALQAPANHYMLVIWDHGGGTLSGVSFDDSSGGTGMSVSDVRQAIQNSNILKFDIVGFDACLMSSIEMASELDEVATLMIASELTEPGDGWDYTAILDYLRSSTSSTGLASKVVDSYIAANGADQHLASVNLGYIAALEHAIDAFATVMETANATDWRAVITARGRAKVADPDFKDYVDLAHFMGQLRVVSANSAIDNAAQAVIDAVDVAVLRTAGKSGYNGLTIVFPKRGVEMDASYTSEHFDFLADTKWKAFLDQFRAVMLPAAAFFEPGEPDFAESLSLGGKALLSNNDMMETPFQLGTINQHDYVVSGLNIDSETDHDWYAFTMPSGAGYAPGIVLSCLDAVAGVQVQLYSAAGALLSEQTTGASGVLTFSPAAGATYLLHVSAATATLLPRYELRMDAFGTAQPVALADFAEAAGGNDSREKAWQLGTGSELSVRGTIGNLSLTAADVASGTDGGDWFRVDSARTTATNVNTVDVSSVGGDAQLLVVKVYDIAGNLLKQSAAPGDLHLEFARQIDDVYVQVQTSGVNPVLGYSLTLSSNKVAPSIVSTAIASGVGGIGGRFNAGDVLTATVKLSEVAYLTDVPGLTLDIGGTQVQAAFVSGSGTDTLVFTYTLLAGQNDANGVSLPANALRLNGGALTDAGGNAAVLLQALVPDQAGFIVDTAAPTVNTFSPADESIAVPLGGNFTLTFGEAMQRGSGNIVLKTASGTVVETFNAASSSHVTVSGSIITVDPTADLVEGTGYRLEFAAGTLQDLAGNPYVGTALYNFSTLGPTITGTASAEALSGTAGNDNIHALAGNDTLTGGLGDDVLSGGDGRDQANFSGLRSAYTIVRNGDDALVSGPNGLDSLLSVERLHFDDFYVALDITGNGGQAYRLYKSALDRAPDIGGLGFQINVLDIGFGITDIAANFIESPEFQARYGNLSNAQFVNQLYLNVLDRDADPGGLAFHVNNLNLGLPRNYLLVQFSESPENQANVIGAIQNGMVYTL